jgi:hypothetical protein
MLTKGCIPNAYGGNISKNEWFFVAQCMNLKFKPSQAGQRVFTRKVSRLQLDEGFQFSKRGYHNILLPLDCRSDCVARVFNSDHLQ